MARQLTEDEKEYLTEAVWGYLNGFNDCGPDPEDGYPPQTLEWLVDYGYKTIAYDLERGGDPRARKLYFCGEEAIREECRKIILCDPEFSNVCIDWQDWQNA